ncbi:MAG: protein kinase [Planctomycetota bacterium]|nr:protein kinase [Planctomycetota bacterium]MDP6761282.1 protein kinase [Planctomycetota bacterium]
MPPDESEQRGRLERAFDDYLWAREADGGVELDGFLEGVTEDLRGELQTLVGDYHSLRQALCSGPHDFWPGGRVGSYTLLRELGRGGVGVVYEAVDRRLDRRVAIKLLPQIDSLTEGGLERFHREASAGGRLSHPAIVAVYDVGREGNTNFIVQELVVGGRSLALEIEELRRLDRLPTGHFRRLGAFFAKVAEGMAAAHAAGVVHRDLKPQNLLITDSTTPKIADFGLALLSEEEGAPPDSGLQGTYYYMSPEQASGDAAAGEPATDIFSLGAVLFETLTLVRPFEGDTPEQILAKVREEPAVDPRRVRSQVPRDLAVICIRALEKEPHRRYASMKDLAADLHRYLDGQTLRARPPSRARAVLKWCRRHKAITSSALLACGAMAALGVSFVQTLAARRSADEALATTTRLIQHLDPTRPPSEELGPILSNAERLAREEFGGRPLVRARLRAAIGFVERFEGNARKAEGLLRKARRGLERNAGEWTEILAVHRALVGILRDEHRLEEAEEVLVASVAMAAEEGDGAVPLELRADLATILLALGDPWRLVEFEARHGDVRAILEQHLARQSERLGPRHVAVLETRYALGLCASAEGDHERTRAELERLQVDLAVAVDPDHPLAILVQSALAGAAARSGRLAEAKLRYAVLDDRQVRLAAAGKPHARRWFEERAWVALHLGELEEAEALFARLAASSPGDGLWRSDRGRARLLERRGDLEGAGELIAEVCAAVPAGAPEREVCELDRAETFLMRGRSREAVDLLEDLLQRAPRADHPATAELRGLLSEALALAGEGERALSEQHALVECLRADVGPHAPRTVEALGRLVLLARGTEREEEVDAQVAEALGTLDPGALGLVLRLRAAQARGDRAAVEELVQRARRSAPSHGRLLHGEMLPLRFALAEHDLERGERERATAWLRRVRLGIPLAWRTTAYRVRAMAHELGQ